MAVAAGSVETLERVTISAQDINTSTLSRIHDTDGKFLIVAFKQSKLFWVNELPRTVEYKFTVSSMQDGEHIYKSENDPFQGLTQAPMISDAGNEWVKQLTEKMSAGHQLSKRAIEVARKGSDDQLRTFIMEGIDLAWQDKSGDTVLTLAIQNDSISDDLLLEMLLDYNANPFILNHNGASALSHACRLGKTEVIGVMLAKSLTCIKHAVYPNRALEVRMRAINAISKGKNKHTPLSIACEKKHYFAVKLLLKNGAEPNKGHDPKKLPLFIAAKKGSVHTCELLLSHGADPKVKIPWMHKSYPMQSFLGKTPNNEKIKSLLDDHSKSDELVPSVKPQMGASPQIDETKISQATQPPHQDKDKGAKREDNKVDSSRMVKFLKQEEKKQQEEDNKATPFGIVNWSGACSTIKNEDL